MDIPDFMTAFKLFTDASVNPQLKVGYGAYLLVPPKPSSFEVLKKCVKVKRFEQTSSTRLELQTLLWALSSIPALGQKIVVYTDSQNIKELLERRPGLEQKDFQTTKNRPIKNYKLYQAFFKQMDQLDFRLIKLKGHKTSGQKDGLDRLFSLVDRASRKALRTHL